jgi:hypothetical protein
LAIFVSLTLHHIPAAEKYLMCDPGHSKSDRCMADSSQEVFVGNQSEEAVMTRINDAKLLPLEGLSAGNMQGLGGGIERNGYFNGRMLTAQDLAAEQSYGDTGLVAFAHGATRLPVIVGSLWNASDSPPSDCE